MSKSTFRGVVVLCGFVVLLLAAPAQSEACSWLCRLFGGCPACAGGAACVPMTAPTYAPAAACPTCAPQVVQYLPQVSYHTVVQRVPVTVCRPTTCSDPCTGCPVTAYHPVTTWMQQVQLVPYTTYRIVYANAMTPMVSYAAAPCGSCSPCAMGGCAPACAGGCGSGTCGVAGGYAPAASCGASGGGCASCAPSLSGPAPSAGSATMYPAPGPTINTTPAPASPFTAPVPGVPYPNPAPPATMPRPAPGSAPPPKTFQDSGSSTSAPADTQLRPIPEAKSDSTSAPKLTDPESRTTSLPIRPAVYLKLISSPPGKVHDGGWRASAD